PSTTNDLITLKTSLGHPKRAKAQAAAKREFSSGCLAGGRTKTARSFLPNSAAASLAPARSRRLRSDTALPSAGPGSSPSGARAGSRLTRRARPARAAPPPGPRRSEAVQVRFPWLIQTSQLLKRVVGGKNRLVALSPQNGRRFGVRLNDFGDRHWQDRPLCGASGFWSIASAH